MMRHDMARRRYTDAEKANALDLYRDHGLDHAVEATGIPKGTIASWAARNGVQTICNERTAAAVQARKLNAAQRKARLADRLLEIAELGTDETIKRLGTANTRDLVGAWTRAIHDAQLLDGSATDRPDLSDRDAVLHDARERGLSLVPRSA